MNTKNLVTLSLFIGIGAVLHFVIPGFASGMKPDMMLLMMFLGILLFPETKSVLVLGITTGFISGLTSTFPGGFLPNMIDKPITAFLFYGLFLILKKIRFPLVYSTILTVIGTLTSGLIFLGSAYFIVGLPIAFSALFVAAVLPATLLNAGAMFILYPLITNIYSRTTRNAQVTF
ncbi:tryptophan transporter [Bacillus sp. 2205SS5-2]|uniref:tryptophan transporter n=1 Tax=Bacillus sp. 2205SS5-2 TaxID=3109031 RepID=UPI003006640F